MGYRDIAGGKPGNLTRVGLGTFADPRIEGGKINDRTTEDLIRVMEIDGEEFLFLKAMPVHVAILRGTTADPEGNISMEREALRIDNLSQAMAAKNSGGLVIVQVERLVDRNEINARQVEIPGAMVDAIVVAEPENHVQTYATVYSPYLDGSARSAIEDTPPTPLDARKVIARRAALELPQQGGVVNLGIGVPEGVADVAREEGWLDRVTLTAEPGVIGGQPAGGLNFGSAYNTDAIICQNQQFDFCDGGGLALTCLGMAEVGHEGNVNVSRCGDRLPGAGGFVNISSNAQKVLFCGTFTAGGLDVDITDGRVLIQTEGKAQKFIETVRQITFSGPHAAARKQPVKYLTERCVFELRDTGLALTEVAPGIDIERDILAHMAFKPILDNPVQMDAKIFQPGLMSE